MRLQQLQGSLALPPVSLAAKLVLIIVLALIAAMSIVMLIYYFTQSALLASSLGLACAIAVVTVLVNRLSQSIVERVNALDNGLASLIDGDFSLGIANTYRDELSPLIASYNKLTQTLRAERQQLYQRELLLDKVIQNSSLSVLLSDDRNTVIYSNDNARQMFNGGKAIQGLNFQDLLAKSPPALQSFLSQGSSGIFKTDINGEEESYHISLGRFVLNTQRHHLYLIKHMTREMNRKEAATWKEVIRLISHELNNSLAPISSLSHSGLILLKKNKLDELPEVFDTISERAQHLKSFIDGYARLSKLPLPQKQNITWASLIHPLQHAFSFQLLADFPLEPVYADRGQLEQMLVNLLKNALESGSPESDIALLIRQNATSFTLNIMDRGKGMSAKELENALLPFYTTKRSGSGVGLALCREIIEAHDGEITLHNRNKGGLSVRILLPLEKQDKQGHP